MASQLCFLHICLSESWGGLEMSVSRWNEILQEKGHHNINICTPESPLARDLKERNAEVIEWDSAPYFSPDFTFKLRRLLKTRKVDHVILQNLRELWLVTPALWGLDVQLVGFTQMLISFKKKDLLHQLIYKRLNRVLTLTDWQQQALLPYLPIPQHKYRTLPNFVDCQRFRPELRQENYRQQLGYRPEHFLIGVIGRIDTQKGQWELLQAFNHIDSDYPNARLLIIGEPTRGETEQSHYFHNIKSFVKEQGLEKRVRFYGFQKDPHRTFANLDLFVLPSYQETFGYVVVESMASGTPVLATQAGGVPEILGQGDYGFLCEPQSADDLEKQLRFILDNKDLRQQKSQRALNRARTFYDRHQVYQRFMEILSQPE